MTDVRVVWMDDTVKTYREVEAACVSEKGELQITFDERIDRSRQGAGRPDDRKRRVVHIPLANLRWWGTPGQEVAW